MEIKINQDRLVEEFMELVSIDSLTFDERKMADFIISRLNDMGVSAEEDDAGRVLNGTSGNLIAKLNGSTDKSPIMFLAHMDTVTPGKNKKAVIRDGVIYSEGKTILGADDLSGVATILGALRNIIDFNIPHGDIYAVFTIAEEGGLWGAKHLDLSKIPAKYAFVMDNGGEIGTVAHEAPSQYKFDINIHGRAAHAGVEPEKGVSAIQIAANAISNMKLGRIDHETTANIGVISGGQATNIICDKVEIKAEARSRNMKKLEEQKIHMKEVLFNAAEQSGGTVDFEEELAYPSFKISKDSEIIRIINDATQKIGIELKLEATGGGSDTNIINAAGIPAVDLSTGMDKVHTMDENIKISDLVKTCELIVAIVKSV